MKYRFFILGLAAALFAACAVNEADHSTPAFNDGEEFYATIEGAATKVYVDEDLKVLWHADDRVSIFNKYTFNQQYRFTGNTGANSGSFQKVPSEDFITGNALDYVYAVYPYQEVTEISNQGLLTVELPATQSYAEDSFGVGANTMVSCSEGNELLFKNLCGYLMLKLYGTDVSVTSISFKGNRSEPLGGKATVTTSVDGSPSLSFDGSATDEITLAFDSPITLGTTAETATTFWLVVPPTTFEGGITLLVKTADGKQFEKSTTGRLDISRNTRSKMAALEVVPEAQFRYLTFTSEGTTKVSLYNRGENAPKLYYSTDLTNWIRWNYSTLTFTIDQPLYLRGNNPEGFSSSSIKFSKFVTAGDNYNVSGDIMSLIDCEHELAAIPCEFCFNSLFRGTGLISAPELPATILAEQCYSYMFSGCTSLATTPELPATSLANRCYLGMFNGCIGLTTALDLPATTLAEWCYSSMFTGCTSLTIAPELPATKLASYCYYFMFSGCSSLMTAPDLLATTLENSCYQGMFYECTQLNYIKCLAEDISASGCLESWVYGVSSTGTFVKAPGVNWTTGTSGIPEGWTEESIPGENRYASGSGVAGDPWVITTPEHMSHIFEDMAAGECCYFRLGADIDMTGMEWTPLNATGPSYDKGIDFDGDDHTISNFNCTTWTGPYASFFGVLYGKCYDVKFVNATVKTSNDGSGILGGYGGVNDLPCEVSRVHVQGSIEGKGKIGGLFGNGRGCVITACSADVVINGPNGQKCGGLVGTDVGRAITIRDSWSAGSIVSTASICGGIVGELVVDGSSIYNCYSTASVTTQYLFGGIVGRAVAGQKSSLANCTSYNPKNHVEKCIAWNALLKSNCEDTSEHFSNGAIVGATAVKNYLAGCIRKPDLDFQDCTKNAELGTYVPFDQEDSDPDHPMVGGAGTYAFAYHGKAAAAGKTVSQVAKDLGWSETVWDLSGELPLLK